MQTLDGSERRQRWRDHIAEGSERRPEACETFKRGFRGRLVRRDTLISSSTPLSLFTTRSPYADVPPVGYRATIIDRSDMRRVPLREHR